MAALEFALSPEEVKALEGKPVRLILTTGEIVENGLLKKFAATKKGNRFRTLNVQLACRAAWAAMGTSFLLKDSLLGLPENAWMLGWVMEEIPEQGGALSESCPRFIGPRLSVKPRSGRTAERRGQNRRRSAGSARRRWRLH